MANITYHYLSVADNAKREESRKKLEHARKNLAREENAPLLQRIVELRSRIANMLGYDTWADYRIEPKMAKDGETALEFVEELAAGLRPKMEEEFERFREMKTRDTGNPDAKIELWDWRYYRNQLKKEGYEVDTEALRVYFPYTETLHGMFRIYEQCFGLAISEIEPTYKWVDDLAAYAISDSESGEPLGIVYLDMFPREGKYNHFAQFGLIEGKLLPDGIYQRPTVALICNFPPATEDKPSLLSFDETETLFHEFGHALHSIVTRAKFVRFSGTSVPRDFVEAPSQMLEYWLEDKTVLDGFAADYRDSSKKFPQDMLVKLKEAQLATVGTTYSRQLAFGLLDLALHSKVTPENQIDVVGLSNQILGDVFLVMDDTSFVTYFGHLMGYDAGYYGYAWADAIAADMATVFEQAPNEYMDQSVGMRLRNEIYAPGGSRDVEISIRKFLGRERSIDPFLKKLGLESGVD